MIEKFERAETRRQEMYRQYFARAKEVVGEIEMLYQQQRPLVMIMGDGLVDEERRLMAKVFPWLSVPGSEELFETMRPMGVSKEETWHRNLTMRFLEDELDLNRLRDKYRSDRVLEYHNNGNGITGPDYVLYNVYPILKPHKDICWHDLRSTGEDKLIDLTVITMNTGHFVRINQPLLIAYINRLKRYRVTGIGK
jgi:hypothetical protein